MKWRFHRRAERHSELSGEIEFHIESEIADNLARGMSAEAARLAAHRKFGNPVLIHEDVYRMNPAAHFETAWRDIRYSWRALRKNPAFTSTAILILALGIGGNAAMFTVIRSVLLKPLEYREPDSLVTLSLDNPQQNTRDVPFTMLRYEETRKNARSFTAVGSFLRSPENMTLAGRGEPEALQGARVSANFLDILGVQPLIGRSFRPDEGTPDGPSVAMISAKLWQRRFDGDPQVAGKTALFDSKPYTIIGVLPDRFAFPFSGTDVWVTKSWEDSSLAPRFWRFVTRQSVFARLQPDTSLQQAQAEMDVLNRQYVAAYPERVDAKPGVAVRAAPLKERLVSNVRPMLWMLFGAVGMVLLIACANLAGLVLARASARSREFAVRTALGAGRGSLTRQLLTESLLLSAIGGAAGLLLARWALSALVRVGSLPIPRAAEIEIDGVVLGFTAALAILTGALSGLFPSFKASRLDLVNALRQSGAASRPASVGLSPRGLLVIGQVALSMVLLIGASLLLQSFARLRAINPGFDPEKLLTVKISLPSFRYDTPAKRAAFYDELERRAAALPGVRNAAIVRSIPTSFRLRTNVGIAGQPEMKERDQPAVLLQSITPAYFKTMGIPLRRGREFTAKDNAFGAPPVFIVNETFARRSWPSYPAGPDPVGQKMGEGVDRIVSANIVGIVADVREDALDVSPEPTFYVPSALHAPQIAHLVLRTTGDPLQLANAVRNAVLAIDPDQPVSDIRTMNEILDGTLAQRRLTMVLLAAFAGVALLLAVIGIYGAIAYSVAQRTQEMGVRRALGAEHRDILRLVVKQALTLTAAGVISGFVAALALARMMRTFLYEVSPTDSATFSFIAVIFIVVVVAASLIPAWRATRIDPMTALRVG